MTPASPPAPRPYHRLSVPAFYPVPTRTRRDGWTIERQADFLELLAETGSVIGACEAVGMSRKSAYRLRTLPGAESFAAAWDAALGARFRSRLHGQCDHWDHSREAAASRPGGGSHGETYAAMNRPGRSGEN